MRTLLHASNQAFAKSEERLRKNVIDPFSSIVIASVLEIDTSSDLLGAQALRTTMGGISNAVGAFHQTILGAVPGWADHDFGYDLENRERRTLAEVKNKHNTMNAANRKQVIDDLETAIRQKERGWTAYLVQIVPKKPERFKEKLVLNRPVYEIDGASFYALATGSPTALQDVYDALVECIGEKLSADVKAECRRLFRASIPA